MTDRKLIISTTIASLLLHVIIGVLTWNLPLFGDGKPPREAAANEVEVILVDPDKPVGAKDSTLPTAYTEMPERLASDTPPDHPDYLALINAKAADRVPGGQDASQPAATMDAEFPQVAIAPENLAGAEGVAVDATPVEPAHQKPRQVKEGQTGPDLERRPGDEATPDGTWTLPEPRRGGEPQPRQGDDQGATESDDTSDWQGQDRTPSILKQGERSPGGDRGFEFDQQAQGNVTGNASIEGDFSLSTYEWNYAPWIHRFSQDLQRNWLAPYAYRLGIIYGFTRIRLVVEKDGRPSVMEIIETEGNESLHRASLAALQSFAPYPPLPADFPDRNLVITLSLHYPQWKP